MLGRNVHSICVEIVLLNFSSFSQLETNNICASRKNSTPTIKESRYYPIHKSQKSNEYRAQDLVGNTMYQQQTQMITIWSYIMRRYEHRHFIECQYKKQFACTFQPTLLRSGQFPPEHLKFFPSSECEIHKTGHTPKNTRRAWHVQTQTQNM